MSKQVLDISQMQHLKELGVDTSKASMVLLYTDNEGEIIDWDDVDEFLEKFINLHDAETGDYDHSYRKCCGVFTLQDILDLFPNPVEGTKYALTISKSKYHWFVGYEEYINHTTLISCGYNELIDSAYETLCWLIENGYIETKKK